MAILARLLTNRRSAVQKPTQQQVTIRLLQELHRKVDRIMTTQDELNAEAQQIETDVASIKDATGKINSEIAALEAQIASGQPVDLTGLKAAVADLDGATTAVAAVPPAPAPPA